MVQEHDPKQYAGVLPQRQIQIAVDGEQRMASPAAH